VTFYGTRLGVSLAKFEYRLAKDFESLNAHGEGLVKSVFAFHPVYRTRNTNLIAQIAYEDKRLLDRIETQNSIEDRFLDSVKAGFVGDFRDRFFGGGLNAFSATYTHGDLKIAPTDLAARDVDPVTGPQTLGTFRKWNYDYKRLNRVTDNASLLIAFSGQQASKNLASAERMSLGGPNGVRAYPVGEANGDTGMLLTAEARYIVPGWKLFEGDVSVWGHYDWGQVDVREKPLPTEVSANKRRLSGAGFGGSLGQEGRFIARASLSWPISDEEPQADKKKREPRIWMQAVKWF